MPAPGAPARASESSFECSAASQAGWVNASVAKSSAPTRAAAPLRGDPDLTDFERVASANDPSREVDERVRSLIALNVGGKKAAVQRIRPLAELTRRADEARHTAHCANATLPRAGFGKSPLLEARRVGVPRRRWLYD